MAAFVKYDITVGGLNIMAKGEAGKKVEFTEVAVGDGFLDQAQDPHTMTALVNQVMRVPVSGVTLIDNSEVEVRAPFSNAQMQVGFSYREIGLYAKDPDTGRDILYCYGNAEDQAEWIPPAGGVSAIEKILKIVTVIGRAVNVVANLKSGIYVTTEDLRAILPTAHIATITHSLDHTPVCALYRTEYAVGTQRGGEGPAGGGEVMELPMRAELVDGNKVAVYTLPHYGGRSDVEIVKISENKFGIGWPDSVTNLLLIMR